MIWLRSNSASNFSTKVILIQHLRPSYLQSIHASPSSLVKWHITRYTMLSFRSYLKEETTCTCVFSTPWSDLCFSSSTKCRTLTTKETLDRTGSSRTVLARGTTCECSTWERPAPHFSPLDTTSASYKMNIPVISAALGSNEPWGHSWRSLKSWLLLHLFKGSLHKWSDCRRLIRL